MRSNESSFHWLLPVSNRAERRDYPMREESPVLSMTDVIWSPPYQRDSDHSHNCMEIGLCLAGYGTICIGGQMGRTFDSGTVVIVPEGVRHSQQCEGGETTRWRYVAVDEARLLRETTPRCREEIARLIAMAREGGVYLRERQSAKDVAWLIQAMFDVKCRYSDEATAEIEALLLLILTRIAREPQTAQVEAGVSRLTMRPVEPALLYVAERYKQEIRVEQLARSCAMSESYFRKTFLQAMGVSPLEYVNRYRIQRAVHMLKTGTPSISRVAEECGFSSIATFNRNFLRYVGQNPSTWRRKNDQRG